MPFTTSIGILNNIIALIGILILFTVLGLFGIFIYAANKKLFNGNKNILKTKFSHKIAALDLLIIKTFNSNTEFMKTFEILFVG